MGSRALVSQKLRDMSFREVEGFRACRAAACYGLKLEIEQRQASHSGYKGQRARGMPRPHAGEDLGSHSAFRGTQSCPKNPTTFKRKSPLFTIFSLVCFVSFFFWGGGEREGKFYGSGVPAERCKSQNPPLWFSVWVWGFGLRV